MKANELTIGNYVKFLCKVRKIKSIVRKDTGVEISFDGKNPVVVSLDEIEPIPLTPEILEKNGWRQYSPYFSNDNADFELEPYRDGGFGIRVSADEYGSGTFAGIKYVHQLQHALRLCGIEKQIVIW